MKPLPLTVFVLALGAYMTAHAQTRKPALPEDTITSEIILQDLLYRHPPEVENFSEEKVFACPIEQQPEYPGGTHAMYKFIEANLRMPRKAKNARISGRVFVSFLIKETGEISDITVLKGLGFGCDEEAVRIVGLMPKWKPARQSNKIVRVKYNLPILFNIN
ncbi:energy transducer TonB [Dyadobacter endophyticus]|nr:energy transducer TonB [Dyadobacter endophyticus]